MKYMTPELIVRGQSSDPAVLDEVESLWEANGERYSEQLDAIREELPVGFTELLGRYFLHDARIVSIRELDRKLEVLLHLDNEPDKLLALTYHLLAKPDITRGLLPDNLTPASDWIEWWYDEIEPAPDGTGWRHSVLLSNGWELVIVCSDVTVQESAAILPGPRRALVQAATAHP